jgi:chromosome segregation ATPase
MLGMTTHSENMTGVQKELWYLINDEDARNILELVIQKMNEAGDGSERLKQLYDEAQTFIPSDTKYDEKYWVAAYILYSNKSSSVNLVEDLHNVKSRINTLRNDLNKLNRMSEEIKDKINDLYEKIKPFEEQIESLEDQLESIDESCHVISYDLYDLERESKNVLDNLRQIAKQIII